MNRLSQKTCGEILGASIGIVLAGAFVIAFVGAEAFSRSTRDAAAVAGIGAIIGGSLLRNEISRMAYWGLVGGLLTHFLFGNLKASGASTGIALGALFGLLHQVFHYFDQRNTAGEITVQPNSASTP